MKLAALFRQIYFKTTGYSFTHLGRLFLRMFVGLMIAQFGVRQLAGTTDSLFYLPLVSEGLEEWLVIIVEIICPFLIMIGLFTRLMILPPFVLMIVSSRHIFELFYVVCNGVPTLMCVPFLFMGILLFLLLVGPGKISVDYFYSLYLINRHKGKEEDLEEV